MKVSKLPAAPKVPGANRLPPWLEMTPVRSLVSRLGFMACFARLSMTRRYSAFSTGKQLSSILIFPASAVFSIQKISARLHRSADIAYSGWLCGNMVAIFYSCQLDKSLALSDSEKEAEKTIEN